MPSQPAPWKVYRQALDPLKYGDALWEPGPIYSYKRVRPGDVGYTRRGRFHLLFSAGIPLGSRVLGTDVPFTFEPLDIGPIIAGEVRPPGYLRTDTIREIGADVGGSVAVACPVEPGARVAFTLNHKQGAALITKHPTYREDIERERTFESYTKRHYDSWVDFARDHGHGENMRPVLVTGVDLTREFATIAYSDNSTRMECEFSAGVPAMATASVSLWGSWRTQGLVHTNCGPHPFPTRGNRSSDEGPTLESSIPEEYNHCVFLRYYTIRRRVFIPTVLKAGAGPHQLPKGDSGNDNTNEGALLVSSEDDPMEVDYQETGSPINASDEVIHNVPLVGPKHYPYLPLPTSRTKDDRDGFDVVAEFIFQRSNAKSLLLHHHDIQDLLRGDEEEWTRLLDESGIAQRVQIDENGVGQLVSTAAAESPKVSQSESDIITQTSTMVTETQDRGVPEHEEGGESSDVIGAHHDKRDNSLAEGPQPQRNFLHNIADNREGVPPPDPRFDVKTADSYSFSNTQGSSSGLDAEHPTTSADFIPGTTTHSEHGGTVEGVFDPTPHHVEPSGPKFQLPPQGDSLVVVPQLQYPRDDNRGSWIPQSPIHFFTGDSPGVKLLNPLDGEFEGLTNGDSNLFILDSRGITIRIHFSGYASSTKVEKVLKQKAEMDGRAKARSMQLSTGNRGLAANSITRSKLVQEVAKCVKWHIEDLEANSDVFPFDTRVDEQWRLGQGKMRFDHMVIIGFVNVSPGSWSPIICVE